MAIFTKKEQSSSARNEGKTKGYINVMIPDATGRERKVGYIPVTENNRAHMALVQRLESGNPEEVLERFKQAMVIRYVPVEETEVEFSF